MSVSSLVTMPLALDFTSTSVMGWTFPVATTERAMSPVSTVPIWDGSSGGAPPRLLAARNPPPASTQKTTARMIQSRLRDFDFVLGDEFKGPPKPQNLIFGVELRRESPRGSVWPHDGGIQAYLRSIPSTLP